MNMIEVKILDEKKLLHGDDHTSVCFEVYDNFIGSKVLHVMCSTGFTYHNTKTVLDNLNKYSPEVTIKDLAIIDTISVPEDISDNDTSLPTAMEAVMRAIFIYYNERKKIVVFNDMLSGDEIKKVFVWYLSRFMFSDKAYTEMRLIKYTDSDGGIKFIDMTNPKIDGLNSDKKYRISVYGNNYVFDNTYKDGIFNEN